MNKWTFLRIDHDDPKEPTAVFDYKDIITVKIDQHLRYTAVNDDTGYACNIPSGEVNGMIERAKKEFGMRTENPVEIKIEIQPEEKTADDIEVCPYPDCHQPIGTKSLTATFSKCPHCDRLLETLIEKTEEKDGIFRKTLKRGNWV